jgi:HlyD family secretion protein
MDRKIEKKSLSKVRWTLIGAGVLITLFAIYTMAFRDSRSSASVDRERLFIEEVHEGEFQEFVDITGYVQPEQTTYLDAIEGGVIQQVYIESGSVVEAGDTLAVLSNSNLQLNVMQQEAGLYDQINNVRNSRLNLEQNHLSLQKELADSRAQLEILRSRFTRDSVLFAQELISKQNFEETEQLYNYEKMRFELNYESYRKDSLQMARQLEQLDDSEERMWISLNGVQQILENLVITAPVSGQLSTVELNPGQSVSQGERLGQVDVVGGFKIRAGIDEFYLARIAAGLEGSFRFAGGNYEVMVNRVYPVIQDGEFEVDLAFRGDEPEGIRRGQSVRIRLELGDPATALLVPRGGFYQQTGGNWIFVLNEGESEAVRQPVRLGRGNNDYFEVLEGLNPGDRVITSGYDTFRDYEVLRLN